MERVAASGGPQQAAAAPASAGVGSFGVRFDDALGRWDQALADVLELVGEPGLQTATGAELMDWSQRIERMSNRAPIAGQYLISCDRTPRWCQRHHLVAWIDGGATDIENLTLCVRFTIIGLPFMDGQQSYETAGSGGDHPRSSPPTRNR